MGDFERRILALKAAGEPTRFRILALLADTELTVTELTQVLGQSQPRVSRHLKILVDAGLLERAPEGTWVFYRLRDDGDGAHLAHAIIQLAPAHETVFRLDRGRLDQVRAARATEAAHYFARVAPEWRRLRALHVDDAEVERALLDVVGDRPIGDLLDIGTGTGRILQLLGPRAERAIGIDLSREMLRIARAAVDQLPQRSVLVRHADMNRLPLAAGSIDLAVLHQVLHFAQDPAAVIGEAARVLRPGGRLIVVDFAPHDVESLRREHQHRRLGFADDEVTGWARAFGLKAYVARRLPGTPLTVVLWVAAAPAAVATAAPAPGFEAAS